MAEYATLDSAIARAQRVLARDPDGSAGSLQIVWTGEGYAVASDFDLETWWLGAPVVAEVMADGSFELAD